VTAVLECRQVEAGYGSLSVVRHVDLSADQGTVVTILGANGAGKTTLLLALAGLLPRQGGQVLVDGVALPSFRPGAAGRAGLVLVPDDRALFCTLTVEENLEAARPRRVRGRGHQGIDDVVELFPALRQRWKVKAGALSGGEQQMLAMARGLVRRPRVLLIDEMSMGLAPMVVEHLMPTVRRIAEETGAVVVLVEQHASLALAQSDQAVVLTRGEVTLAGPAAEVAARPDELQAAYLGSVEPVVTNRG
jgi:branched-chain amino acid transport system ATP-binding protein